MLYPICVFIRFAYYAFEKWFRKGEWKIFIGEPTEAKNPKNKKKNSFSKGTRFAKTLFKSVIRKGISAVHLHIFFKIFVFRGDTFFGVFEVADHEFDIIFPIWGICTKIEQENFNFSKFFSAKNVEIELINIVFSFWCSRHSFRVDLTSTFYFHSYTWLSPFIVPFCLSLFFFTPDLVSLCRPPLYAGGGLRCI